MKTTQDCINYLRTHPYLKKGFAKLKANEVLILENFLEANKDDGRDALSIKANRLFLDAKDKPKNWTTICEMASCAIVFKFKD